MFMSVGMAAFHYLALGIGLGGVFMRGRYLRTLIAAPKDTRSLESLFIADNLWGLAALLWISTGLARAFGGLDKGTAFYIESPLFRLKMGLFALVFILEVLPMVTLIRWRIARKHDHPLPNWEVISKLRKINDLEVILVTIIPFVASGMARGLL